MANNTRIHKAEITGIYGFLLKTMARRMFGHVPESIGVMWHHPAVLKDLMGFGRKAEKWDRLDPNVASFAAMAAAGAVGCSFCLEVRSRRGCRWARGWFATSTRSTSASPWRRRRADRCSS
jgi:hypothetical protein